MPHDQDVEGANDPDSESTYECLECGTVTEATTNPGLCECGGEYHNRAKSLE